MNTKTNKYYLCGRVIESDYKLDLPEVPADKKSFIKLKISWASKLEAPKGELQPTKNKAIYVFKNRLYFVRTEIAVGYFEDDTCKIKFLKKFKNSEEAQISILHHTLPYILAYKGDLIFHASSVGNNNGAVAFIGLSGRGKSTTAALLTKDYGFKLLGDEFIRVSSYRGEIRIHPSLPEIRLETSMAKKISSTSKTKDIWGKDRLRFKESFLTKSSKLKGLFLIDGRKSKTMTEKLLENAYFCSHKDEEVLLKHFSLICKTISQYQPIEVPPQRGGKQFSMLAEEVQLALS